MQSIEMLEEEEYHPGSSLTRSTDRRRKMKQWAIGLALLLAVGIPVIIPILYVVGNSFSDTRLGQPWGR